MYQRVMQAYQEQSPRYGELLHHYNARCLSGGSVQPGWQGHPQYWYGQDRGGYENDRRRGGW